MGLVCKYLSIRLRRKKDENNHKIEQNNLIWFLFQSFFGGGIQISNLHVDILVNLIKEKRSFLRMLMRRNPDLKFRISEGF